MVDGIEVNIDQSGFPTVTDQEGRPVFGYGPIVDIYQDDGMDL